MKMRHDKTMMPWCHDARTRMRLRGWTVRSWEAHFGAWWRDVGGPWEVPGLMKAWINRPWDVWDVSFILFAPTTYRPQYLNLVHSLPSWEVLDQLRSKPTELAGLVNCREPMTMTLSETSEAADLHVQLLPQSHQSPIFPFQDLHISSTFRPHFVHFQISIRFRAMRCHLAGLCLNIRHVQQVLIL